LKAVALAGDCRPDVILMDVSMEGMNGVEATARIKAADPAARIVALSMHDDPVTREMMMNAGAAAFLHKSDTPEKIVEVIRDVSAAAGDRPGTGERIRRPLQP
jgi:DNA-binding NarL/FixJ family response regulator